MVTAALIHSCATEAAHLHHPMHFPTTQQRSSVRLLVAGTGRGTAELLGLAATRVSDQQGAVVGSQDGLDLVLGRLVHDCGRGEQEALVVQRSAKQCAEGEPRRQPST